MAFTYVNSVYVATDSTVTSLDMTNTLNVQAGDILIAVVGWEEAGSTSFSIAQTDGTTNVLTTFTEYTAGTPNYLRGGYILNASASASATFRLSIQPGTAYIRFAIYQFRSDAGTIALDVDPSYDHQTSTALQSGNISTTGVDIVLGWTKYYNGGTTTSAQQIADATANTIMAESCFSSGYRIFTTAQTNIHWQLTESGSDQGSSGILAIKSTSSTNATAQTASQQVINSASISALLGFSGNEVETQTKNSEDILAIYQQMDIAETQIVNSESILITSFVPITCNIAETQTINSEDIQISIAGRTVTIKQTGGTYTGLQAAITAEVASNSNLSTIGVLTFLIQDSFNDNVSNIDISGFTNTDASHYPHIFVDVGYRPAGKQDDTKYRISIDSQYSPVIYINVPYTRITCLQAENTNTSGGDCFAIDATGSIIDSCICYGAYGVGFSCGSEGGLGICLNCIESGCGIGYATQNNTGQVLYCYNDTACHNGSYGFAAGEYQVLIGKNCYSGGNTGNDFYRSTNGTMTLTNCFSEDGTRSTGTVAFSTATFLNVTTGSEDLHLAAGSGLIGQGTSLVNDPSGIYSFNTDIDNQERGATWDVGADQYSAQGVSVTEFSETQIKNAEDILVTYQQMDIAEIQTINIDSLIANAVSNITSEIIEAQTIDFENIIQAILFNVIYDGMGNDGGSVPVDANWYESGSSVTVLENSGNLTNTGYFFSGWVFASGLDTTANIMESQIIDASDVSAASIYYGGPIGETQTIQSNNIIATQSGGSAAIWPPTISQVGYSGTLTTNSNGTINPGTYDHIHFTNTALFLNDGAYTFTNCLFDGFDTWYGGYHHTRTVLFDHCTCAPIVCESGGQAGLTIKWCYVYGGTQALRPKGVTDDSTDDITNSTPFLVEDSIIEIPVNTGSAIHAEAMQTLGGRNMTFNRVAFITDGPNNGTQTGSVNCHYAGDTTFDHCDFLESGAFNTTVYARGSNNSFHSCRLVGQESPNPNYYYTDANYEATPAQCARFFNCTNYTTNARPTYMSTSSDSGRIWILNESE
jgi:hypothetical protein